MADLPDWTKTVSVHLDPISPIIGDVKITPWQTIHSGQKTVATAGSAEVLAAASTAIKAVAIKALPTNTGKVYVGDSGVSSANGFVLSVNEGVCLDVDNLQDIYLDVSVNGEGASYVYISET